MVLIRRPYRFSWMTSLMPFKSLRHHSFSKLIRMLDHEKQTSSRLNCLATKLRPKGLALKSKSSMAFKTFSRVRFFMLALLFKARETVEMETPALSATSYMVGFGFFLRFMILSVHTLSIAYYHIVKMDV